ncbi:hypothetical protein JCM3770_006440 [Rhodotorula araucariae]
MPRSRLTAPTRLNLVPLAPGVKPRFPTFTLPSPPKPSFIPNAPYELDSDLATCYEPTREAILECIVEHWGEVHGARRCRRWTDRAVADELVVATAATGMMLAKRLAEKTA